MANKARVKVESKYVPSGASQHEKDQAFKAMMVAFRKKCNEYDIAKLYREHESFESKSRRKRRKRREAMNERHRDEMKRLAAAQKGRERRRGD